MIQSHIGSSKNCGVIQLERFSHLLGRSFGLSSPIGLVYLSLFIGSFIESQYVVGKDSTWKRAT